MPLVTAFGAVAAAVWAAGWLPASVVAIIGYFACSYLFIPPRGTLVFGGFADLVGMIAYLFTCGLIIGIGEAMRAAKVRADRRRDTLWVTLASIGDAVITTDIQGRVSYLNAVAESLTGWKQREAIGQPLEAVFRIVDERRGAGREPRDGSAEPRRSRAGESHGADRETRRRASDRRQRIAHPGRARPGLGMRADLPGRDRAAAPCARKGGTASRRPPAGVDRRVVQTTPSSASRWTASSKAGTPPPSGCSATRPSRPSGATSPWSFPPTASPKRTRSSPRLKAGQRIEHFETERVRGATAGASWFRSPSRRSRTRRAGSSGRPRSSGTSPASGRPRSASGGCWRKRRRRTPSSGRSSSRGRCSPGSWTLDGTLLEANRLSWEGCGYTQGADRRQAVLGRPLVEPPRRRWCEQIKAASAPGGGGRDVPGGDALLRRRRQRADGRRHDRCRSRTRRAGCCSWPRPGIDITDRKRAEADRQKFVTLVENSTDFIGMCDLEGVPFFVNRAGLEMVGLDDIEQARRTPVRGLLLPGRPAQDHGRVLPVGAREGPRRDRGPLPALQDRRGALDGLQGVDAAGRRRPADRLRDGQPGRHRAAAAGGRPAKLAADLSEADRRKNEFLAMLAHELRNPLAPISNAVRALRARTRRRRSWRARRSRCSSGRSARWRGWSTTCST